MPTAPTAIVADYVSPTAAAPGAPTGTPSISPVAPVAMLANFVGPTAAAPGAPTGMPSISPVAPVAMLADFVGPTAAAPGAPTGTPSISPVAPVAMLANFVGPTAAAPGAPTGMPSISPVAPVAMQANFVGPTAAAPAAPLGNYELPGGTDYASPMYVSGLLDMLWNDPLAVPRAPADVSGRPAWNLVIQGSPQLEWKIYFDSDIAEWSAQLWIDSLPYTGFGPASAIGDFATPDLVPAWEKRTGEWIGGALVLTASRFNIDLPLPILASSGNLPTPTPIPGGGGGGSGGGESP